MAGRAQYQYETSPRKIEEPYTRKKVAADKQKNKKTNLNKKSATPKKTSKVSTIFYLIICFAVVFGLGYRNTQIDESFVKLQGLKTELSAIQKENEQLEVSIENSLNLSNVEEMAREKLGMQKLDNNQKVYINLPKRDYVELAAEKVVIEESNWFDELIKMIKNIF